MHLHDGFYFRGALGVGALFGSNSTVNGALLVASAGDFDSSGIAVLSELAFGGSPLPGLVIGGGSYGASVPSTSYEVAGSEIEGGTSAVSVLGPFIDIYPDPSAGLHLQFAPGLGAMNVNEGDFASDTIGGLGFGFMAGAGYEFWIGEQWSIGGLARVLYARATIEDQYGHGQFEAQAILPGVLFTATYH